MKAKLLVMGLIGVLYLIFDQLVVAQNRKELVPYLRSNSLSLETANPVWQSLFDDRFYQNNVFLLGERHGIAYSYEALWKLVVHLKTKTNFRYYLLEAPLYWELNLNQYFDTGDETYLKKTFHEAKGTFYANQDFYEFYRKLYAFNQSLPVGDRIQFISLDVEHQYKYSHAMLLRLFGKYAKSSLNGSEFVRYFFDIDPEKTSQYQQAYTQYQTRWYADSAKLKPVLGNDYELADYLIRNINFKFRANEDPADLARDSLMYLNLVYRGRGLDIAGKKAFGFMGIDHCYTKATPRFKYFAAYLPTDQYKTVSTLMLYCNSETLIPNQYLPKFVRFLGGKNGYFTTKMRSNDRPIEYQRKIGALKEATQSTLTLFRLNRTGSPFSRKAIFIDDLKTDQPTTDFVQYLVLVRNSPAASVWNE